ncbi:MAG: type I-G CRISPR-associated protein Csb2 [Streptosporangiaceae bacterium]
MATTVAVRFPLGRYHATPWDRSVNEGAAEWPPSPWRVLRALVSTWYTRWPDLPAPVLDALLDALGDPPAYRTPPVRAGHTRHYMPDLNHRKGETGGTDLTLDPFLSVGRHDELLIRWEAQLPDEHRDVLAKLAELVPYLGRADSVCEARLLDEDPEPDDTWWLPGTLGPKQVRLLAPARPATRLALEATTVSVRHSRRTMPAGAIWVNYAAGRQEGPAPDARRREEPVYAIRFHVAGRVPLRSAHGILMADAAHRYAGRKLEQDGLCDERRQVILGSGGAATNHGHAHWIPIAESSSRGAIVSSLILWVPGGMAPDEAASIVALREVYGYLGRRDGSGYDVPGFPDVTLLFQAAGPIKQVAPELCGTSRRWRSLTPYLPVRHRKHESLDTYLSADVSAELRYRGQPPAVVARADPSSGLPDRWSREFRRYRLAERLSQSRPGIGLRLEFAEQAAGPILLGQLSHFGYGIFVPEPG